MQPFFSVIIPVYNVEKYIKACVASILEQQFKDLEIILIDDGSIDHSGDICDELEKKFFNVKTVHKSNGGLASARNEGLKYAEGKYISFVDSDDWVEKNLYQKAFEILKQNEQDIITYGYRKVCNEKILIEEHAYFPEGEYNQKRIRTEILPDSIAEEKAFAQVNLPVQLSACMCIYRRMFLMQHDVKFESERLVLNEDWLFNIRCLCRAQKMFVMHDILYDYNTREDSLSMTYKSDAYERKIRLYKRYMEELKETGNYTEDIELRLKNFWMESIYTCYSIELHLSDWNRETAKRVKAFCNDHYFRKYMRELNLRNCTIKGIIFTMLIKLNMHTCLKCLYSIRKTAKNLMRTGVFCKKSVIEAGQYERR